MPSNPRSTPFARHDQHDKAKTQHYKRGRYLLSKPQYESTPSLTISPATIKHNITNNKHFRKPRRIMSRPRYATISSERYDTPDDDGVLETTEVPDKPPINPNTGRRYKSAPWTYEDFLKLVKGGLMGKTYKRIVKEDLPSRTYQACRQRLINLKQEKIYEELVAQLCWPFREEPRCNATVARR